MQEFLRQFGVQVVDIDNQMYTRNGLRTEMRAYKSSARMLSSMMQIRALASPRLWLDETILRNS